MIEGGKALDLVTGHVSEAQRVAREIRALLAPLGVAAHWTDNESGVAVAVRFADEHHADFTKPKKQGICYPKKNTEWAKLFEAQKGYESPSMLIAQAFNVPLALSYGRDGSGGGSRLLGVPFAECGFMWIQSEKVFAMWTPDVEGEVRETESRGYTVAEPAKSFRLQFDGCRRILREEWDAHMAQYKLKRAQEAQSARALEKAA